MDDEFHSGARPSSISQAASIRAPASTTWKNLGTQKEVKKENEQLPAKWTETKVPRIGKVLKHVEAPPPLEVFVDEECEEAQARIKAKNASVSSTTLRQRVDGVCDLRRFAFSCYLPTLRTRTIGYLCQEVPFGNMYDNQASSCQFEAQGYIGAYWVFP